MSALARRILALLGEEGPPSQEDRAAVVEALNLAPAMPVAQMGNRAPSAGSVGTTALQDGAVTPAKLSATAVHVDGTYTGNGTASQAVAVAFRPRLLVVTEPVGNTVCVMADPQGNDKEVGIGARAGTPAALTAAGDIDITATGFTARGNGAGGFNQDLVVFYYVAYR